MVAKKKTAKRTTKKSTSLKMPPMQSFKVAKTDIPFTTMRLTKQTAYWIFILAVIVAMQLWIIKLQLEISHLTDLLLMSV
jgi:hypothetical protein